MNFRAGAALAAVLFTSPLLADQIIMNNGDRVTGSIIKKDAANLTIKSAYFGTITLPWNQIQELKSDQPLTVVLPANKTAQGTLIATPEKSLINSETVPTKDIVAIRNADEQKAYLRMLHPKLTDLWGMTGNIGFAGTAGNARTHTITVPLNFVRATAKDNITANFNLIRSAATINGLSSETASAVRGGWAYNRNLNPRTFVSTLNNYEYDRFQNLDLRAIFGAGLGAHLWKAERGFLDLTVGGDYNHEKFAATPSAQAFSRSVGELYWGDNLALKLSKKLSITQSYRMFNNLSDAGAYRQNADLIMSLSVSKHFTWNASVSDRYLTNPSPGFKRNDFLYSTGLGFKFTR